MKVAVASIDGTAISQHFGRSRCFIIFDVQPSGICRSEVRDNTFTAHAKGECDSASHSQPHHHAQPHSHADIISALRDCQALLCGGMGWRAAEELQANGIRPVMVDPALPPEQAVRELQAGTLRTSNAFCRCHEAH